MFRDYEQKFRQELSLEVYKQGLALAEGRKYKDAIERYEESIELDPNGSQIPAVQAALAYSLRKDGRAAEALGSCQAGGRTGRGPGAAAGRLVAHRAFCA